MGNTDKDLNIISKKLEIIQTTLGRMENRQVMKLNSPRISENEFKVFSQWGEDGIIQYLIRNIDITRKIFIEFGVEDYTESNTRFLLLNNHWTGLVIDGSEENIAYIKRDDIYWKHNLKAEYSFITAENIDALITKSGISGDIGLMSIDIDGNDYWVWKAIHSVKPDIVICEYNHRLGKEKAITVPYDPNFVRRHKHYSNIYYGASIKALERLGHEKGYSLVAGNTDGNNLFFVKNELINENVTPCSIEDAFTHANYRESRDPKGNLSYLSLEEEQNILHSLEFVNLDE